MLIGHHAIIALSAILIAILAIFFLAREINRVSDAVVINHRLTSFLKKHTELLSTLKRDAQIVGTNDLLINNAFISGDNILEFVVALESLALKNSTIQTFRFGKPAPSSVSASFPLVTIPYTNTLTINVLSLSNYLKDFERLPYFTKIESLDISSQDKVGWHGVSTASFRATLFTKATQ